MQWLQNNKSHESFLKIIAHRLYKICEEPISPTQLVSWQGLEQDTPYSVNNISKVAETRIVEYMIVSKFITRHNNMMKVLPGNGIDGKDLCIIKNPYCNQSASINVINKKTEKVKVLRGVRQLYILYLLYWICTRRQISQKLSNTWKTGILLNGQWLNNFRYVDDTFIFTDTWKGP